MVSTEQRDGQVRRVLVAKEGALGWLCIDNPARLNAMSLSMWTDLQSGIEALEADGDIRAIIVAGNDGRAFCAGGDISEFDSLRSGVDSKNSYDVVAKRSMKALREANKPTIALIKGYCLGGGLGLAIQCDLRFADESAKLGIPAAKRGLAYDFNGVKQLVDLVGPASAKDILYTARQIDGRAAQAMGLVNEALSDTETEAFARSVAAKIAENAPLSIFASKMMVDMAVLDSSSRDLERCSAAEAACLASEDYSEATRSFMEKRPAKFLGR